MPPKDTKEKKEEEKKEEKEKKKDKKEEKKEEKDEKKEEKKEDKNEKEASSPKRRKTEELVVPAAMQPAATGSAACSSAGGGGASGIVGCPKLPAEKDIPRAGTRDFMKTCVPWVNAEMPKFLKARGVDISDAPLPQHGPLFIDKSRLGSAGVKGLKSFKESWNPTNCAKALADTGFYEAGGNVTWFNPEVVTQLLPTEDPPLSWVVEYKGFEPEIPKGTSKPIIRFPAGLEGVANRVPPLPAADEEFGSLGVELTPLAGHSHMYAWYYQAVMAVLDGDLERAMLLYQCALTTTICIRVSTDKQEIAEASTKYIERVRSDFKVVIDNFVTFSDKVMMIIGEDAKPDLKQLVDKDIRYQGGLINQTMLRTIVQLRSLQPSSKVLINLIDREFGKDVVSSSYNKLRNLLYGCSTGNKHEVVNPEYVDWALQCLLVTLRRKEAEPSDFKGDTFTKKGDRPSWIGVSLAQQAILTHLNSVVQGLGSVNKALSDSLLVEVMAKFASYMEYDKTFPTDFAGADDDEGVDPGEEYMASLSEKLPKGGVLLAEILRKVFDGTYDDPLVEIANDSNPSALLANTPPDQLGQLGKDLRELMRNLHASEAVVPSSSTSAPKASLRDLVRQASDTGDDPGASKASQAEREDLWKRATTHRKKFITVAYAKDKKLHTLSECYQRAGGGVRAFSGVLNEAHRLVVVSADLLCETQKQPWREISDPGDKDFGDIFKFMSMQRGSADVTAAFDGLSRVARKAMDAAVGELPGAAEVSLTYTRAPHAWCRRKNFFGSKNMEIGYVAMPTSRAKISVKDRGQEDASFNAAGEDSTHYTTYTGIPTMPRHRLALINDGEKVNIVGSTPDVDNVPEAWTKRGLQGVPLYWGETKSVEAWTRILKDTSAKAVVDLSAGSGTLACACMGVGALYVGFVYHKTHLTWLTNVVDRASLKYLVQSGTTLYQEDLATHVKQVFADLVEPDDPEQNSDDDEEEAEDEA